MSRPRLGLVTLGQTPREDIVPEMAAVLGPGIEILERGALDGLDAPAVSALAPGPDEQVLITRLRDGTAVFVSLPRIAPRVQACLHELDREGVALSAVLCTGTFPGLAAAAPLLLPDRLVAGVLRGLGHGGRLGVLVPSDAHRRQAGPRWRALGAEPVVAVLSPYGPPDPAALAQAAEVLASGEAALLVLDCMGYRRQTRDALRGLLGIPVLQPNLLLARVAAELLGG